MTNVPFETIRDFRDLDSINAYHELTEKGIFTREEMMKYIRYKSRDNARTPMQWDTSAYAGFSESAPWIMVNPNYKRINAKEQMERETSVFHYYKKLIALRHKHDIIVYGSYELLLPDHPHIYAYIRTLGEQKLLVVCSFSSQTVTYSIPKEFESGTVMISNYETGERKCGELKPYEALVILQSSDLL